MGQRAAQVRSSVAYALGPNLVWRPQDPQQAEGVLVANGNANRPAMVNLDGFQYGMTQCIKIPDQGETYELYAPAQRDYVSCVIESSESLNSRNEAAGHPSIANVPISTSGSWFSTLPSQLRSKPSNV